MKNEMPASTHETLRCATRYPILLVHGLGVRDGKRNIIWGRIPQTLRSYGAEVYFGEHDAWGTPDNNAVQLLERLPAILAESGATKVNIIAHSKGGIDVRHLIKLFEDDEIPIASLTTISTPHHGSRSMELLMATIPGAFTGVEGLVNGFFRSIGDKNPDYLATSGAITVSNMKKFNASQPNLAPLYSQQFSSSLHGCFDDFLSLITYPFVWFMEGPNDGLVARSSAAYDNYCGELSTKLGRGIPHALLVDALQRPFSTIKIPGTIREVEESFTGITGEIPLQPRDIVDFYIAVVADLKTRGL